MQLKSVNQSINWSIDRSINNKWFWSSLKNEQTSEIHNEMAKYLIKLN